MNINTVKEPTFLIVDEATSSVFASTYFYDAAIAITLWSTRIKLTLLNSHLSQEQQYLTTNYNDVENLYCYETRNGLVNFKLVNNIYNHEIQQYRKSLQLRLKYQEDLCNKINNAIFGWCDTKLHDKFSADILHELNQCNVENNLYTNNIIMYALINDISPKHAYHELKMFQDNLTAVKVRLLAQYIYHRNKYNNVSDNELEDVKKESLKNLLYV
jgi:hypothetical protein